MLLWFSVEILLILLWNDIKCQNQHEMSQMGLMHRHYIIMPEYLHYVEWQYINLIHTQDVDDAFSSFGNVIHVMFYQFCVS